MAPYGRGGAGNYEAIQRENEKISKDLEASQSAAEKATNNYLPPDIAERSEAQYAHTGRGGAGNYYSPKDLAEHGNFSGAQTSHIRFSFGTVGDGTPAPSENVKPAATPAAGPMPTGKAGRGGAGNFEWGTSESDRKAAAQQQEEVDRRQQKLKDDVEKGVKDNLAFPSKAKLPDGEPF